VTLNRFGFRGKRRRTSEGEPLGRPSPAPQPEAGDEHEEAKQDHAAISGSASASMR
jgi:hypothetical protein